MGADVVVIVGIEGMDDDRTANGDGAGPSTCISDDIEDVFCGLRLRFVTCELEEEGTDDVSSGTVNDDGEHERDGSGKSISVIDICDC